MEGKDVINIALTLRDDVNIVDISRSKKSPYFYMLLDYGTSYLCLRSNRRTYALDIIRQISKEEISQEEAAPLLEAGEKFFRDTDRAVEKYLKKYGVE